MTRIAACSLCFVLAACGDSGGTLQGDGADSGSGAPDGGGLGGDAGASTDSGAPETSGADAAADAEGDVGSQGDASMDAATDSSPVDASSTDASSSDASAGDASSSDAGSGIITGGPCLSGAPGATAIRIRFHDANGQAYVSYEAFGLPDHSREQAGAYGYQIGFAPSYVDDALAQGGVGLDGSDFIDLDFSTVGISTITSATLSVYGRSYSVDTNASFDWQTFVDTGTTPTDFVSNVPPYAWYSADVLSAIDAGDGGITLRIKAGPSSNALAVNAVELCLSAK